MNTDNKNHLVNFRRIVLISLVLSVYTLVDQYPQYHGMGSLLGTFSGTRLLQISPVMVMTLLDISFLVFSYRSAQAGIMRVCKRGILTLRKINVINWAIFAILALVFPFLVLSPTTPDFDFMLTSIWIFGHLVLLGTVFLRAALPRSNDLEIVVMAALFFALVERIALYIPDISNQMTSLGWSEASRYYYASLFFSRSIYGIKVAYSSLHPSRYLLQSIPFIIPNLPIWAHRAWQVVLWLALPIAGSLLIVRRLKIKSALMTALVTIWGYLFLNQGPVYYHLMICVIIIAAGFSSQKPIRSLFVVLLASAWAGISRINWFPVPGLMAVFFYLLEVPCDGKRFWRYWLWPFIWVVSGLAMAFLAETAYIAISGNPTENFGTSFTSSLLWYRLFPNITYPNGILISILLVIFPVLVLYILKLGRNRGAVHWERLSLFTAILMVFFAGGIVVSVKIGGGSNLHNMDAFLVFMLIAAVYLFFDHVNPEAGETPYWRPVHWVVTALLIVMPLTSVVQMDAELKQFDNQPVIQDLVKLQEIIDARTDSNGEILFISQRHYITFNYVHGVTLVPEYEKVFLMEMAMADNQSYLDQFEQDLKNHRYALIISEPLAMVIQNEEDVFFEENNAWTTRVTSLIRKYYHESVSLPNALIVVLEPNP
jgi:hypothetical protein